MIKIQANNIQKNRLIEYWMSAIKPYPANPDNRNIRVRIFFYPFFGPKCPEKYPVSKQYPFSCGYLSNIRFRIFFYPFFQENGYVPKNQKISDLLHHSMSTWALVCIFLLHALRKMLEYPKKSTFQIGYFSGYREYPFF